MTAVDIVARVDDLPSEVLSTIFVLVVGRSEATTVPNGPFPSANFSTKSLIRLTHVCSSWRTIATSTRLLWSNIHFSLDHPFSISHHLSNLYIARSSPCLFDLTFSIPSYFVYPHLRSALNSISAHFERVHTLRVDLGLKFGRELAMNEILGWLSTIRASSLEVLELCASETVGCTSTTAPRFSTRSFDSLSCVSLRNVTLNLDRSEMNGLSTLELDYTSSDDAPSLEDISAIVKTSPGLTSLRVGGAGIRMAERIVARVGVGDAVEEMGVDKIGSLRCLEVSLSQRADYASRLFHSLRTPGLRALTISVATPEAWAAFLASTASFIAPSTITPYPYSATSSHPNHHHYDHNKNYSHQTLLPHLETLTLRDTPTLITADFAAFTPHLSKLVVSSEDYSDLARFLGCVSPAKVRAAVTIIGRDGKRDGLWMELREIVVERKGRAVASGGAGLDGLNVALARRRFSGLGEVKLEVIEVE